MDDSAIAYNAVAGGGQSTSYTVRATMNYVTAVTAADSVTLPSAALGLRYTIYNVSASNSMNVFPAVGDKINAVAVNGAFALAALLGTTFYASGPGQWNTLPKVAS